MDKKLKREGHYHRKLRTSQQQWKEEKKECNGNIHDVRCSGKSRHMSIQKLWPAQKEQADT